MKMKGQFALMIIVFLVIMLLPLVLGRIFPFFELILKVYLALVIFLFVRNIMGSSVVSYLISGLLIYIFLIRLYFLAVPVYMLYIISSMMLSGIIIFGLQKH